MNIVRDPYLELPLHGLRLIEASAGTGKTFTLATLATRLVLERGLRVGDILAVTYTEAATQELRRRIRERLQLALELVDAPPAQAESAEAILTRQLLQARLAHGDEDADALRRRLRRAVLDVDLAAVFTIHGFCARVLREHALEAGQGFDAPELLADETGLREEVAADLWRAHARDDAGADDLAALWKGGYEELAKDLPALLRERVLLPPDAPLPPDPAASLQAAADALVRAIDAHSDDAQAQVAKAFDAKVFDGRRARHASFDKAFDELRAGRTDRQWPRTDKTHLQKLLPTQLLDYCKDGQQANVPVSAVFDALETWCAADEATQAWLARRRIALLHRLRDDARVRLARLKRQRRVQTYDDMIDGVADALAGANGDALAARLREQYRVALVDEFQDTDARQWAIFERVFARGEDAALLLIGDPKQAIYGFRGGDVHAYLEAAQEAQRAPPLVHNFRSRPALLAAIDALYANANAAFAAGDADAPPFVDPRIAFHPVEAGGQRTDEDFRREGANAPALTLWQAPATGEFNKKGEPTQWRAGESREHATRACVAAIHRVLADARAGRATIEGEPVRPGDIAVLVRSHAEATRVRQALALAGIPAVAAGKLGLFATAEARELHALLLALLHAGDDGRLRAALATVLVGVDAAGIDALDAAVDGDAHRHWQQRALRWRERLLRGGPLALVGELCAGDAQRLLGLLDGERRLSNYLQLAEALQEAQERALGLHGLVDWLGRRIAGADKDDETQLLRLESDARRVQIVTLHKSKGLEYPLVFLPFAGIGRDEKPPGRCCIAYDEHDGRGLHWKLGDPAQWKSASDAWRREQRAEDARLLYVGLTRARQALWIATGPLYASDKAPLANMLRDVAALRAAGVVFDATPAPEALPRLPPESDAAVPAARVATRRLHDDWWVYSFSQLSKAEAGDASSASTLPVAGGNDEPEAPEALPDTAFDARFAGNRYGVALHAALERMALAPDGFAAWRDWRAGGPAPQDEAIAIAEALRAEGYGADVLEDGVALTTGLVGNTLTVALPEGARLCELPFDQRRPEIEFQFALRPVQVDALLKLLHAHGVVRERHGFGLRQRLEGLMTGLIDLTYRHAGKWYLLDYKSNRLPAYDAAGLERAMAAGEYDLQALIYTLALHRWLRFRLGAGYDYARNFGGIRYLFCRGLDASRDDSPGIHAQRFAPELVHALDALFGHASPPLPPGKGRGEGSARAEVRP
ncbi:MAG: exodeoxyribonuclease V subunit beta [Lysobacterales bacterium]